MSNAWLLGFLLVGCAGALATQPRPQPRIEHGSSTGSHVAGARPSPPADLDARLVRHYPLRGFVLSESGYAVVAFSVAPSGAVRVPEVLEASRPAYGDACRAMLEESQWTPARDEHGQAVAFSGSFNCSFEHPHESAQRATSGGPAIATPPIQPDYGEKWFEQFSDEIVDRDMGAVLEVEVDEAGRVKVLGVEAGGQKVVADACTKTLYEGPRWVPAKDAAGRPVRHRFTFPCKVQVDTERMELVLSGVGAAGPIAVETVAEHLGDHVRAFSHCFESAAGMDKQIRGAHWAAFEILPSGHVSRVEWVERPLVDEVLQACVFGVLREFRFAPAKQRTIADVQLELGGVQRFGFRL